MVVLRAAILEGLDFDVLSRREALFGAEGDWVLVLIVI
jgi:hypothetical protein